VADSEEPRTYSGRLASLIVLAVVVVFVLLNVVTGRYLPQPSRPVAPPTVTERPAK
jgi:hypothetical protein